MNPEGGKGGLGLFTLSALVAASMIGAGVFTTSGYALADLGSGPRVMLAWVVGAIIALCGAVSYGALSRRIAGSGGEYLYLSRAVHPLAGFLAGWVSLLAGFTGAIAFAALALESYLRDWLPALPPNGIAILAVVLAGLAHGIHLRPGVRSQNALVALKLGWILVFVGVALVAAFAGRGSTPVGTEATGPATTPFRLSLFASSLVWISLSYSGFNAAVYVAGEARAPSRNVPRAMLWATLGVSAIYLLLNGIFVLAAPADAVRGRPDVAAAAAAALGGESLAITVRVIITLALLSSVSSMMMAGPRVYARMADDGLFPALFRFRGELPRAAILLQGILAIVVILLSDLRGLLSYLGLTLSLSAAATVASLFWLRTRHPGSVQLPGWGLPSGFYVLATVILALLAARASSGEFSAMILTLLSGSLAYFAWSRLGRRRARGE